MSNQPAQAPSAPVKGEWFVMDGRARYDTDRASIMECVGRGVRDQVPRKAAAKNWRGYDACICFGPTTTKNHCGPIEYVEDVSA